jgi:hypothetical protein
MKREGTTSKGGGRYQRGCCLYRRLKATSCQPQQKKQTLRHQPVEKILPYKPAKPAKPVQVIRTTTVT